MGYKLTHPDSAQEIEVDKTHLQMYLDNGWETKPGAKAPADDK